MKFIVDEMPKYGWACPFFDGGECKLDHGHGCDRFGWTSHSRDDEDECKHLKSKAEGDQT